MAVHILFNAKIVHRLTTSRPKALKIVGKVAVLGYLADLKEINMVCCACLEKTFYKMCYTIWSFLAFFTPYRM